MRSEENTTSPGCIPIRRSARWIAAVPALSAAAYPQPVPPPFRFSKSIDIWGPAGYPVGVEGFLHKFTLFSMHGRRREKYFSSALHCLLSIFIPPSSLGSKMRGSLRSEDFPPDYHRSASGSFIIQQPSSSSIIPSRLFIRNTTLRFPMAGAGVGWSICT